MPSAVQKCTAAAASPDFQSRVKLALVKVALAAFDDGNTARASFARRVLKGEVNMPAAAIAVVVNPTIAAAIAAYEPPEGEEPDGTFGVSDEDIAFTVAEGGDPATGVFHKLATANAGGG